MGHVGEPLIGPRNADTLWDELWAFATVKKRGGSAASPISASGQVSRLALQRASPLISKIFQWPLSSSSHSSP
jgi:hypothetical protein